jgi:hypothetical protein
MLYMGLWNLADEHGRLNGDSYYIKGQIFPYDDDLTPGAIDALIDQLDDAGKAIRYADSGDPYLFLPKLDRHQRLEADKVPSRLPAPPEALPHPPAPQPKTVKAQAEDSEPDGADSSESRADSSAPHADESALLYVAGSMEHGAWSMEHVLPRADMTQPPLLTLVEEQPLTPLAAKPVDLFDDFWDVYPRSVGKDKARTAFATAVKRGANPDAIITAAASFAARCGLARQETKFIPHPTTWLNRGSWSDDLDDAVPIPAARSAPQRESATDRAVASGDTALAEFRRMTGRSA